MSLTDYLYRRTTTIQMHDGRRVIVIPSGEIIEIGDEKSSEKNFTLYDSGASGDTGTDTGANTFTESELLILKQF